MTQLWPGRTVRAVAVLAIAGAVVTTLGVGPAAAEDVVLGTVTVTTGPNAANATAPQVDVYARTAAYGACRNNFPATNELKRVGGPSLASSSPYTYKTTWQCIDDTSKIF